MTVEPRDSAAYGPNEVPADVAGAPADGERIPADGAEIPTPAELAGAPDGAEVPTPAEIAGVPADVAARLLRAIDRSPSTVVALIDADLKTRWVSRSAAWVAGTDPTSRSGRDSLEALHPDDVTRLVQGLELLHAARANRETGDVPVMEPLRHRVRGPDGEWMTMESLVLNLLDDPLVSGLVSVGRPVGGHLDGIGHIVDLLVANAPLPNVLAACAQLVPEYLGSAAVVALADGETVVGAPSGSPAERLSSDRRWWLPTTTDGRARVEPGFAGFPHDVVDAARREGFRTVWVSPLFDVSCNEVMGAVVTWIRIEVEQNIGIETGLRQTERLASLVIGEERRRRALRREAATDPLTGVGNRSAFRRRLDAAGDPVTVAMLDCDGLKAVNDTYGHDAGDAVLRAVAERLVRGVREDDLVVRLGGDEFAIVFGEDTSDDGIAGAARRVSDAIMAPIEIGADTWVSVSASVGVATGAPGNVVRQADRALYAAKRRRYATERPPLR